ncbi:hypothetical protein CK203_025304 [Vitis vinifera]|uniref:Uncharacterized protein n=1 Tax=Vitis vinifera TaxID=29760 RepID=A0A438IZV9_VITVI|nr:hypothetical protein CK203_025304 [Vitis vinifera]
MARLLKERVRARLTHKPFDYPFSIHHEFGGLLCEGVGATDAFKWDHWGTKHCSGNRALASCPSATIDEHETFVEIEDIVDGAVPHDEYIDEMLTMIVDDLLDGPVEGASDFMDPPLSFDALSGFVSHSDNVHDSSFMDLSIFEELRIRSDLSTDERDSLVQLLKSYLDVFAWSYEDMPDPDGSREHGEDVLHYQVGYLLLRVMPFGLKNAELPIREQRPPIP